MTKHSKNNTASSIFSYAEYKKLDYGTKRQRLGNESMKPFDACSLCLQQARDPVACQGGHIFCKECIYADLLTQKSDIKRQKERIQLLQEEEESQRQNALIAARERVLLDFERGQIGMGTSKRMVVENKKLAHDKEQSGEPRGAKRKFEFDKNQLEIATGEAEEAALRQIEGEQAEIRKAKLPDFWLPSLTPDAKASLADFKDVKLQTLCNASFPAHPLGLKNLIAVSFTSDVSSSDSTPGRKMCPSCKKGLSNSVLITLMKPCSHIVCRTCYDTLVVPGKQCAVCETQIGAKDIIELTREGTGFAGGGRAETKKSGVAFQG